MIKFSKQKLPLIFFIFILVALVGYWKISRFLNDRKYQLVVSFEEQRMIDDVRLSGNTLMIFRETTPPETYSLSEIQKWEKTITPAPYQLPPRPGKHCWMTGPYDRPACLNGEVDPETSLLYGSIPQELRQRYLIGWMSTPDFVISEWEEYSFFGNGNIHLLIHRKVDGRLKLERQLSPPKTSDQFIRGACARADTDGKNIALAFCGTAYVFPIE